MSHVNQRKRDTTGREGLVPRHTNNVRHLVKTDNIMKEERVEQKKEAAHVASLITIKVQ